MEKVKKVRKNIVLSEEAENILKNMSQSFKISQSELIENLLIEKSKEFRVKEKLMALKEIKGVLKGTLKNKKIQDLKAETK